MSNWHWDYGWTSRFDNGEEYEWLGGMTREAAEQDVRELQAEEDATYAGPDSAGHLTYFVQRRKVVTPGPWEIVEEQS